MSTGMHHRVRDARLEMELELIEHGESRRGAIGRCAAAITREAAAMDREAGFGEADIIAMIEAAISAAWRAGIEHERARIRSAIVGGLGL